MGCEFIATDEQKVKREITRNLQVNKDKTSQIAAST